MEAELQERRSGSANETPRLRGLKIPRSGGTKVQTIEARVTYQNIEKMAQGSEPGVVTRMVLECSRSVQRWSGVSEVGVEVHGYDNIHVDWVTWEMPCQPCTQPSASRCFCRVCGVAEDGPGSQVYKRDVQHAWQLGMSALHRE